MPELPEVQTTVNGINQYVVGLKISDVWSNYQNLDGYYTNKNHIKDPKFFTYFKRQTKGKKIKKAERRAKNILIHLDDESVILVHMKMTGHLLYGTYKFDKRDKKDPWKGVKPKGLTDPFNRHIRFIISFTNGKFLALSDMRRFAKVTYIPKEARLDTIHLKDIGPEPLDPKFTIDEFKHRLAFRPNRNIKSVLLEPKVIAGIGNIYSDEILWRANIHPERKIKDINDREYPLMFKAMRETLLKGIDFGGDSMSDYRNILGERGMFQAEHNGYRKTGTKCKKKGCQGTIVRKIIGGRSAHFCNIHQM